MSQPLKAPQAQNPQTDNVDQSGPRLSQTRHYEPAELELMGKKELEKIIAAENDLDEKLNYESYRTRAKWNDLKTRGREFIKSFLSSKTAKLAAAGIVAVGALAPFGYQQYKASKSRNSHIAIAHTLTPRATTVPNTATTVRVVRDVVINATDNTPSSNPETRASVSAGLPNIKNASVERGLVSALRRAGNNVMNFFSGKRPDSMARIIAQGANDKGLHVGTHHTAEVGVRCHTVTDCSSVDVTLYNGTNIIATRTVNIAAAQHHVKLQEANAAAHARMVRRVLASQPPVGQLFDLGPTGFMASSPSPFPTQLPEIPARDIRGFGPASTNTVASYRWSPINPNQNFTSTSPANIAQTSASATIVPSQTEVTETAAANRLLTTSEINNIVSQLDGDPRVTTTGPGSLTITFTSQDGNDIELTFFNLHVTPTGAIAGSLPAQREIQTISSVLDGMLRPVNGIYLIAEDIRGRAANLKFHLSRLQNVRATPEQRQKQAQAREIQKALDALSAADKARVRR